jgi:hypothetical protein
LLIPPDLGRGERVRNCIWDRFYCETGRKGIRLKQEGEYSWRREMKGHIMLIAGNWCVAPAPATDLLEALSRPQDPYRDSSEQRVDDFYQHVDHKNDPPFRFDWRARPLTGLSFRKHP